MANKGEQPPSSGGPSMMRFQLAQSLDVSSVVQAPASSLIRGLHPKCVCFHPTKPLLAVGVSGYVAVYDLQSGTRVGRVDLKSVPLELAFAPDGSVLIAVVQDWMIYSVSTASWKARLVVPRRAKMDKPLERVLLAVAPGSNPFIYFARYAKDTLRLALLPSRAGGVPAPEGGAGGGGKGANSWGTRVKLDAAKPILQLACHHVDAQLLALTADGLLRGYAIAGGGGDVLTPLYALLVQDPMDKLVPLPGVLVVVPHPALPTGALILQGSRMGTAVVLELPGRTTPSPVIRGRVPNWQATIGMGVDRATGMVMAFGLSEGGRLRCASWRLSYRAGSQGVALRPSRMEPQDLTGLVDATRKTRAALVTHMAAGAAAAAAAAGGPVPPNGGAGAMASMRSLTLGGGAAGAGGAGAGGGGGGAGGGGGGGGAGGGGGGAPPAAPTWHGLWSLSPAWATDMSSSCLLEAQLAPSVGRVVVHPALGCVAVAPEPPAAAAASRELLFGGRGGLSPEEMALARRTSTVSLLLVHNAEAHAGGWRGARASPQHTALAAWLPPGARLPALGPPGPAAGPAAGPARPKPRAARPAGDSSTDEDEPEQEPVAAAEVAAPAADAEAAAPPADSNALQLPPHVYYVAGGRLMKYGLVTRSASPLAQLPTEAPDGDTRLPRMLVHSARRGAWLVFFEAAVAGASGNNGNYPNGNGTAGGAANGQPAAGAERFTWTLVNAAALSGEGGAGFVSWVRTGKYGTFLGPDDSHFAVLSSNGRLLEVYNTAPPGGGGPGVSIPMPLLSCSLDGAVLGAAGVAAPLFPGPPMWNAPVPDARAPPDAGPHDARRFRGLGCLLWQGADSTLRMATLPALTRVPLDAPPPGTKTDGAGSDSDDDAGGAVRGADGSVYYPSLPQGHHFGPIARQAAFPLLPHETVLHVAWQSLSLAAEPAAGSKAAEAAAAAAPSGPADAVAAVLTSQRLLLLTAGLRQVASVSLSGVGSAALGESLTSVLWAGPMLLACSAAGQVLQLTWTGQLLPVATLSPGGHVSLLGVTADSLIVLRSPLGPLPPAAAAAASATGANVAAAAAALAEAVSRPAALLQPLLIGWSSLAATGLLSYGSYGAAAASVVRPALRHALASYDPQSATPRGVWALISAGAWDVAAAVAGHMPPMGDGGGAVKLAAAAAAGSWAAVAATLQGEASRALHAPAPPPRGSELHAKLVAAAAGALFHGQVTVASDLFLAAGEWPSAMVLAVCSGNVSGVYGISQKLASSSGPPGVEGPAAAGSSEVAAAGQLATALRSLYGGVGSGALADATLALQQPQQPPAPGVGVGPPQQPEPLERADRWPLASPLASAAAVTVPGALPRVAYTDAEIGPVPPAGPPSAVAFYALTSTAAASVAAAAAGGSAGAGGSSRVAAGLVPGDASAGGGGRGGSTVTGGDLETTSVASSDAAQAAARAEFMGHAGLGLGGPTIDFSSDDDSSISEATGSAAGGAGGGARRQIKIQIRDKPAGSAAPDASLREAAKALRLGPGAPPLPGAASVGGSSIASAASVPAPPPPPPAVQFPPGMTSAQLFGGGMSLMETGDWRNAAAHFARAMSVLRHEEAGAMDAAARAARQGMCASYYAAVRLLEAVGTGSGPREARLYRYLAGLRLTPQHGTALLREAITRNRLARNYRYAGDQLTSLIGAVADSAPADYLAQLQADIEECDRAGGRDASVPADEQVADWAALVAAAGETGGGKEDVDALVTPLLA
ncbi:hypothetical protein HYH03_003293 [Edaphochlamys debaryana]|uniref:Uncharacterized protein n=1 Tax=Edaphochlamys debaryana TaxID=47281 RepID=A0A835Y925_9CHLO|nr:hypothetical protein HYH03_003293 [Edaphochlamys debaryana]|eukprot:KAG2498542.1 hypothetical protein HYH03_003293 [Edaphochlamys debaryana]